MAVVGGRESQTSAWSLHWKLALGRKSPCRSGDSNPPPSVLRLAFQSDHKADITCFVVVSSVVGRSSC